MRVGFGYDVHILKENRKLILGGVEIKYNLGLYGHSDADVLTHAIMDAILGAAARGDIGHLFPDTDSNFKDADSIDLLKTVVREIEREYSITNIDATIVAQEPKLSAYIEKMRENISRACKIDMGQINIKATTEEGKGISGNKDAMAAYAVCLIDENNTEA
ncbi:MAG: 2-C-methyl-D-erythritol 2,4-cyclodiphosphate synthase [Clostridia bacterium]|nr:2-C-methyl-D-erythritol 2,4-cyclodiphosphate synthase [Clostridia bacterium]